MIQTCLKNYTGVKPFFMTIFLPFDRDRMYIYTFKKDDKFYVDYEGLRAAKIERIIYSNETDWQSHTFKMELVYRIAGKGTVSCKYLSAYKTIQDFKDKKQYNPFIFEKDLDSLFLKYGTEDSDYIINCSAKDTSKFSIKPFVWIWDGAKSKEQSFADFYLTFNGSHFDYMVEKYPDIYYKSKAECEAANEIQVYEF